VRARFAFLLAVGLGSGAACAGKDTWRKSAELYRGDHALVQKETRADASFAHPAELDGAELSRDLCALRYIDRWSVTRGEDPHAPWSCEDATQVGEAIARGLATAGSAERVRFWVRWRERDIGAPWYVPDERHTRGVAFVNEAGQLELNFDWVHRVQGDAPRANKSPEEARSRRVRLVPPRGVELGESEGKRQPLRLIWPMPDSSGRARVEADVDPATRARMELLEEMLEAGEIDQATYERRKGDLLGSP
jgi:hypothetical protein